MKKFLLFLILLASTAHADELTVDGRTAAGHIIEDEGTKVRQRVKLNFTGAGVSVADTGGKTVVTISGGSGGSGGSGTELPATDTTLLVKGSVDSTKRMRFEVDGLLAGQNLVLTTPATDTTLIGLQTTDTLTNKTLTAANNVIGADTSDAMSGSGQIDDDDLAAGAVDGGLAGEIADASVTADDLGVDSVSASELNATGVEAELEAVIDLQDLQGAVTDGQIPAAITRDTEWDTIGEIETATSVNILLNTEIDTSAELKAILGDETGSGGAAVFATGPTLAGPIWTGLLSNSSTSGLTEGISLGADVILAHQTGANARLLVSTAGSNAYISALNINNQSTGSAAGSGMLFTAGADTANIGGIGTTRTDASSNSVTGLRVLSNGTLSGADTNAPIYVSGAAGGTTAALNGTAANKIGSLTGYIKGASGTTSASATIPESDLSFTDITTNNASTTKHGFLKKLSNVSTEYMDGTGNYSVPAGTNQGWTDNGTRVNSTTATDNFIIGSTTGAAGTSGTAVLGIFSGVAPSTSPADMIQLYAKDGTNNLFFLCTAENGADASTAFLDTAQLALTITTVGNAQVDTAQAKFGTRSILFDNSGDRITTSDNAALDPGVGAYAIRVWTRFNTVSTDAIFCSDSDASLRFQMNSSSVAAILQEGNEDTFAWTPSTATWYFVELSRDGSGNIKLFIDGTQTGSTATGSDNITLTGLRWGSDNSGSNDFDGWMDDLQYIVGTGGNTTSYTAPTAQAPATLALAELMVRDEAGNITTASPHNLEGLPTDVVNEIKNAQHIPMTIHHTSPDGLTEEWIDVVTMAKELEVLSGKKIIYSKTHAPEGLAIDQAKMLVAAEHPEFDQRTATDHEILRRATWTRAKVEKEAEFQLRLEAEGKTLKASEQPPLWMRPLVEEEKQQIQSEG